MGSQETSLPDSYQYKPGDARHDIQEGWWVVKKYNCMGCHQFYPGQRTILMGLKQYQEAQEQLPPKLLTEGARVSPEWLRHFLSNPALSCRHPDTNRDGRWPYPKSPLMPTFSFSDNELRTLVRFFEALSQQPLPYIPEQVPLLSAKETDMARSLFSSTAAPCLKCHATGDPQCTTRSRRRRTSCWPKTGSSRTGRNAGSSIRRPSAPAPPCPPDYLNSRMDIGFSPGLRRHPSTGTIRTRPSYWWTISSSSLRKSNEEWRLPWDTRGLRCNR